MTIFKQRETGEEFDDGVPGDLGANAPRDIAYWHFNSANFDVVGPSPEAVGPEPTLEGATPSADKPDPGA